MADKTPDQLSAATAIADTDLLMVYPTGGPLNKITWLQTVAQIVTDLTSTFLKVSNNLSDINSAGVARTNLGLGTASVANTGTTSGTVPVLGTGGKLPTSTIISLGAFHVQLQRSSGNDSADTTPLGAWTIRLLNTSVLNTISGASLSSNQVTLPSGIYRVSGAVPGNISVPSTGFRPRLRDVTNSTTLVVGSNVTNPQTPADNLALVAPIAGVFTLTGSTVIELQTYSSSIVGAVSGISSGEPEVFTSLLFEKLE